jgi:hypothetical protein
VPIGIVCLANDAFVEFDEWSAKRLRTPAEAAFWLQALLLPGWPAQLARVLQFQAQLTDAIHQLPSGAKRDLWRMGFADEDNLVLPGVGFLPLERSGDQATKLRDYFNGVRVNITQVSEAAMRASFASALSSDPIRVTKDGPPLDVYYTNRPYPGYVMFTWARTGGEEKSTGSIPPHLRAEIQLELTSKTASGAIHKARQGEPCGARLSTGATADQLYMNELTIRQVVPNPKVRVQIQAYASDPSVASGWIDENVPCSLRGNKPFHGVAMRVLGDESGFYQPRYVVRCPSTAGEKEGDWTDGDAAAEGHERLPISRVTCRCLPRRQGS